MIDYIRCHYINSENGIQCESWHSVADGDMCPVHVGMVSSVLAANGVNRDEYIDARKKNEVSWRDKIQGKTPQEQCNIIDAHLAGIEKVIEEQKLISLVGRAIRSEVIEGMSEEDRQIRRNMKVPKSESVKKTSNPRVKGTPDEMLKAFMAKYPSMTLDGAKEMLGLDQENFMSIYSQESILMVRQDVDSLHLSVDNREDKPFYCKKCGRGYDACYHWFLENDCQEVD